MTTTESLRLRLFPDGTYQDKYGYLIIGGCNAIDLIKQYGSPLYVFDEYTLRAKCREFIKEFTRCYPDTLVTYASKAFLNKAMALLIKEEGLGLDIVSGGELFVAQSVGFSPELIYFHGNNKTPAELKMAMQSGVGRIVIDNDFEIETANRIAGEMNVKQNVMLRINPGIDPHTHKYTSTSIPDSKFGFPVGNGHARRAIEATLAAPNLTLTGLHMHLGSPIAELEPYEIAVDIVMKLAAEANKQHGYEMDEFAAGGGFAVAYTTGAKIPRITDYAQCITDRINACVKNLGLKSPKLSIEPGRAIAGPSCVALYTAGAIKDIPGIRHYVSVDGGMGDNIRTALYEAQYEAVIANKLGEANTEKITISGRFCESGDLLIKDIMLPRVFPGDIIAIPVCGAYCIPMSSNYNMVPRPAIVMVSKATSRIIRARETYDDLMRLDSL